MTQRLLIPIFATLLSAGGLAACGASTGPPRMVASGVMAPTAPATVFHEGRLLHYRLGGYYYYDRGIWVRAQNVPYHCRSYHGGGISHRWSTPYDGIGTSRGYQVLYGDHSPIR